MEQAKETARKQNFKIEKEKKRKRERDEDAFEM
jgi:hypothetical protein